MSHVLTGSIVSAVAKFEWCISGRGLVAVAHAKEAMLASLFEARKASSRRVASTALASVIFSTSAKGHRQQACPGERGCLEIGRGGKNSAPSAWWVLRDTPYGRSSA
jgi:hypothetical protein